MGRTAYEWTLDTGQAYHPKAEGALHLHGPNNKSHTLGARQLLRLRLCPFAIFVTGFKLCLSCIHILLPRGQCLLLQVVSCLYNRNDPDSSHIYKIGT